MGKIQTKPENKHNSDKIVKEFCPVCKIEFDDHHTYLEVIYFNIDKRSY